MASAVTCELSLADGVGVVAFNWIAPRVIAITRKTEWIWGVTDIGFFDLVVSSLYSRFRRRKAQEIQISLPCLIGVKVGNSTLSLGAIW